jgi:hypothetical protein
MPPILTLSDAARQTLEAMRDRHPIPYVRERACALLRLAAGHSPTAVARGGLRPRDPRTITAWFHAFVTQGLGGLYQSPRRRAFSP